MSPNAHDAVHFSKRTFSPKLAPTAFESHVTNFSPDGGFMSGATVVVVTTVVVAASGSGVTLSVVELDD